MLQASYTTPRLDGESGCSQIRIKPQLLMINKTRQRSMTIGTDGFLRGQNLLKPLPEWAAVLSPVPFRFVGWCFPPPARWGLLDFIRAVLLLRLLLHLLLVLLLAVQIPVGTAGPPPRAPDPSGHCRTTASSRSQWALPDLHRDLQIAVGTAGPQPRLPGCSGHCRTSTAISRSQWALPDLNRDFQVAVGTAGPQPRAPDPSGHCWTSTAR